MDKRYWNLTDMYRDTANQNGCSNGNIPSCINDDFCVSTPRDMNNGILTMAFIDMQPLESVYPLDAAYCNGTLFPNLNKPFYGGRCK